MQNEHKQRNHICGMQRCARQKGGIGMTIYGINLNFVTLNEQKLETLIQSFNTSDSQDMHDLYLRYEKAKTKDPDDFLASEWLDQIGMSPAYLLWEYAKQIKGIELFECSNVIGIKLACPWDFPPFIKQLDEKAFHDMMRILYNHVASDNECVIETYEIY